MSRPGAGPSAPPTSAPSGAPSQSPTLGVGAHRAADGVEVPTPARSRQIRRPRRRLRRQYSARRGSTASVHCLRPSSAQPASSVRPPRTFRSRACLGHSARPARTRRRCVRPARSPRTTQRRTAPVVSPAPATTARAEPQLAAAARPVSGAPTRATSSPAHRARSVRSARQSTSAAPRVRRPPPASARLKRTQCAARPLQQGAVTASLCATSARWWGPSAECSCPFFRPWPTARSRTSRGDNTRWALRRANA
jgi:hypothetical protein